MSTNDSSTLLSATKLGENNYTSWASDMKAQLLFKKVWGIVSGSDVQPTEPDDLRAWNKDTVEDRQTQQMGQRSNPKIW